MVPPDDVRAAAGSSPTPRVVVRRSARRTRTVTAYRERDAIVVVLPERMTAREEQRYVDDLVAKVLAREARVAAPVGDAELAARARDLVARYLTPQGVGPVQPASVVWVGNQARRWGSCTPSTGAIRLSDRLRPMPVWVLDYVLLHELVHLVEPHHSARFHALVGVLPQAERARGYLEGHQAAQGRPAGGVDEGAGSDDAAELDEGSGADEAAEVDASVASSDHAGAGLSRDERSAGR